MWVPGGYRNLSRPFAMPTRKLTQAMVDRLTALPDGGDLWVWDAKLSGFGVRVRPSGRKSWVYTYRAGGRTAKKRRLVLGDDSLTLEQARAKAIEAMGRVEKARKNEGLDPIEAKRAGERERLHVEALPTVATAYAAWLGTLTRVKPRVRAGYLSLFTNHAQTIAAIRVDEVTSEMVGKIQVGLESKPIAFNRLQARLRTFFKWCESQQYRPRHSNPTDGVKPYREEEKDRPLTAEQLTAVFDAITRAETEGVPVSPERTGRTSGSVVDRPSRGPEMRARRVAKGQAPDRARSYTMQQPRAKRGPRPAAADAPPRLARISPTAAAALRLLLITGWREQEVLALRWADVNMDTGAADLSDTKTGRSLRPLSDAAVALLRSLPRLDGCPFVFPSARRRKDGTVGPLTDISSGWYNVRHAAGVKHRLHDLRHTVATHAASSGMDLYLLMRMLGHKDTRSVLRYAKHDMASLRTAANTAAAIIESYKPRPALKLA